LEIEEVTTRIEEVVVVPVYQGGEPFQKMLQELLNYVGPQSVLVVDDGSSDNTSKIALEHGVHLLRFENNRGKGTALEAGLRWWCERGAERVVTIDADGQHPPELVKALFEKSKFSQAGIVVAARNLKSREMPVHRMLSNRITTRMLSLLAGVPLFDSQSGFRCYHRRIIDQNIFPKSGRFAWESEMLVLVAQRGEGVESISMPVLYSKNSISHIAHFKDTLRFIKLFLRLLRQKWVKNGRSEAGEY